MPSPLLTQAKLKNSLQPCRLPGCHKPRQHLGAWCSTHSNQAGRLGHPHAKPYRRAEWAPQRAEVQALIASNADHPGLRQVLRFLADWMATATHTGDTWKGAREVARLVSNGIRPEGLLVEVCAAFLFLQDRPHALPDDTARDFFLSRAVFAMVPRRRRPCGVRGSWTSKPNPKQSYAPKANPSALAFVGKFLRESLAVWLVNVVSGVEAERAHKLDPLASMRASLRAPSSCGLPFPG